MKNQRKKVATLKAALSKTAKSSGKSYAEIGRIAGVHSSQVSRICNGEFETLSENVMQICKALEMPVEEVTLSGDEAIERKLQAAVLSVWDRTPEDAKRLTKFLQDLSKLRATSQTGARINKKDASHSAKREPHR